MLSWLGRFALDADNQARCSLAEGRRLARQVAEESGEGIAFGAEMVLQHYRHPPEVTIEALIN